MKSGIYEIICLVNNLVYVGKTYSKIGFNKRFEQHKSSLNKNKHFNHHLQNSWNKYGKDEFEFRIIEECIDGVLDQKEKEWIKNYRECSKNICNCTDGGTGGNTRQGTHQSEECKKKISLANLGKKRTYENKIKLSLAHRKYNTQHQTDLVRKFHTGRKRLIKTGILIGLSKIGKKQKEDHIAKRYKSVIQLDVNNNIINKYKSIKEAQELTNTYGISKICDKPNRTANGFIWKYQ